MAAPESTPMALSPWVFTKGNISGSAANEDFSSGP
jgi:hypothetical protein